MSFVGGVQTKQQILDDALFDEEGHIVDDAAQRFKVIHQNDKIREVDEQLMGSIMLQGSEAQVREGRKTKMVPVKKRFLAHDKSTMKVLYGYSNKHRLWRVPYALRAPERFTIVRVNPTRRPTSTSANAAHTSKSNKSRTRSSTADVNASTEQLLTISKRGHTSSHRSTGRRDEGSDRRRRRSHDEEGSDRRRRSHDEGSRRSKPNAGSETHDRSNRLSSKVNRPKSVRKG